MSVDKFRFVSPGVFVNEIDDSTIPRQAEGIGPVIVGRSLRGPVMRPVRVRDYSQFSEVFGEPHPGGTGGDVWREGNKSAPTYGAYAAQAYLKNSAPLTFIRLAGYQIDEGGAAGWSMKEAYGIFVMPISGTNDVYTTPVGGVTASLAAVIYASGSSNYGLVGTPLSGGVGSAITTAILGTWIRADSDIEFTAVLNGESKRINFLEDSKKYIRTVLNTNPILTNKVVTGDESVEDYFLGESYKTFIENNSTGSATNYAAVMVRLGNTAAQIDFANHQEAAKKAESGWVVSQHKGLPEDFVSSSDGNYPVQKLFKFHSLSEGDWNSQNIKLSIEDIKEPANKYLKFGSFTVSVRKLQDNDLTPQYLERFTDLTLDPYSENYVAKRIGDKYSEWNYSKKAFDEYGTYNNLSKFIRVEVDGNVDAGLTDTDYIPYGFYLPNQYTTSYVSASLASAGTIPFIKTSVTGNQVFEARFALPTPPMMPSTTQSPTSNFNSVYFGVKTNIGDTKRFLTDVVDTLKTNPINYTKQGHADKPAFLFSLDDLSGSFTVSGSLNPSQAVSWQRDNRKNKFSMTAVNSSSVLLSNFNRFTLPLVGGSDGVDITQKDPFCYEELLTGNEYTNYAYNSVKVAIESIADAEVVEMNLASVPGVVNPGLTSLLIEKCELRGDALAVIDLEGDLNPSKPKSAKPTANSVLSKLSVRNLNSSYGCAFYPWVLIKDVGNNNTVWVPPSVVALGTFSSSQAKTELWFAPAGFNRGGLSDGAAGLPVIQTAARVSSKERDDLYTANVNPIATFPSEGIVIFGQKTLQATPSALDRINVRRLMIYVKKEISRMASTVLFDPNVQITWKRFIDQAEPFLANIKSRFGLSDFKVVLDQSTTTPDLVDRNIVYAKIMLKPTRAIEFIGLDFVITNSGASFAD